MDIVATLGPHVKTCVAAGKLRELPGAVDHALATALDGIPGPVALVIPWYARWSVALCAVDAATGGLTLPAFRPMLPVHRPGPGS